MLRSNTIIKKLRHWPVNVVNVSKTCCRKILSQSIFRTIERPYFISAKNDVNSQDDDHR